MTQIAISAKKAHGGSGAKEYASLIGWHFLRAPPRLHAEHLASQLGGGKKILEKNPCWRGGKISDK